MNDLDYLREALAYGQAHSSHVRTRVGAVLVSGDSVVYGANRLPPQVRAVPSLKYEFIEHAERAAIYAAAANGVKTAGATLYAPWFACVDCARAIILSGIREVVGLSPLRRATPQRWVENIEMAETMLMDARVGMRWLSGPAGVTITFNGSDFRC